MNLWLAVSFGLLLSAYLCGSFPTGYLVAKAMLGIDIREVGSGSTGATNILRTLGKGPAIGVLLIDVLKGIGAIAFTRLVYSLNFMQELTHNAVSIDTQIILPWAIVLAALLAIIGHSKSIWLGFSGGKSVATSLGVLLGISWPIGLSCFSIFLVFLAITRIVSLSSIMGVIGISILMYLTHQNLAYQMLGICGGIYVIWLHRKNIERLLNGTEPKIGEKLTQTPQTSEI